MPLIDDKLKEKLVAEERKLRFEEFVKEQKAANHKGFKLACLQTQGEVPPKELKKEAFNELLEFYHPKTDLPRPSGKSEKVLDYVIDSQLIFCAFLEQYGIDLTATDETGHFIQMHWHKFLALLSGLHNTKLNEVMSWRCWDGDTKTDYGKQMAKLRAAWELPPENQEEIDRDLEAFNAL